MTAAITALPTYFVSHGSPMTILEDTPARTFLLGLGEDIVARVGRPKAILIATAHFEAGSPAFSGGAHPPMIYDFGGFPQALFEMEYPAPGDPALAARAVALLESEGVPARAVERGFDHGTWVPLKLMFPAADIPVVQVTILSRHGAGTNFALGRALAPLREEGVLIIGSGSLTHNLWELSRSGRAIKETPEWVSRFGDWVKDAAIAGDAEALTHYRERAPFAVENHPSEEHFLPLPFALGAAGPGAKGRLLHESVDYGILRMDAYEFA